MIRELSYRSTPSVKGSWDTPRLGGELLVMFEMPADAKPHTSFIKGGVYRPADGSRPCTLGRGRVVRLLHQMGHSLP